MSAEKLANQLTLEKAALLGILDLVLNDVTLLKKREYWRNRIANNKFISPMDWCDELPFMNTNKN